MREQIVFIQVIKDRNGGDCQKHACNTDHPSADDDADQNPQAGYAKRVAKELRLYKITVGELENNGENQKVKSNAAPSLQPGETEITANVTVTYQLK